MYEFLFVALAVITLGYTAIVSVKTARLIDKIADLEKELKKDG